MCRTSKAATVCVYDPGKDFEDWCAYHKRLFDLLLVRVDEPSQADGVRHLEEERVVIDVSEQIVHPSRLTQTLLRQEAGATAAVEECVRRGIEWLLHLDSDELFVAHDVDVWEQDDSIGQVIFVNHEACPKWTADNPFREIRHFKRNGKTPFLLYQGGKAAVRCAPGVRADGPHRFANHAGAVVVSKSGCILHYACCSFEAWFKKYRHLGVFSNWYGDNFRCPITLDFHLESREVVQGFVENGDIEACRSYFAQAVWDDDELKRRTAGGEVFLVSPDDFFGPCAVKGIERSA
jgi:hypothetical protein